MMQVSFLFHKYGGSKILAEERMSLKAEIW